MPCGHYEASNGRNSPMIWWPFNMTVGEFIEHFDVVTHQWSGDPSILPDELAQAYGRRNSPMIWWPFNTRCSRFDMVCYVVTHQWSGDPSIVAHLTKCFIRIKKNISPFRYRSQLKNDLKNINYVNFYAESIDASISPIKIIFENSNVRFS